MSREKMNLKKADYECWNQAAFVTLNEFIYLAFGCEPLDVGPDKNAYLNLSNNDVKEFYKKTKRLGEELPLESTAETEVKGFLVREPKYEAVFLIKWAKSKNIKVNSSYNPIESEERQKIQLSRNLVGRHTLSRDEFVQMLVLYNPDRNETYFKTMLLEAVHSSKLHPLSEPHNYSTLPEERNFKFQTKPLLQYASEIGWVTPEELHDKNNKILDKQDPKPQEIDIHPNRLKTMLTIILSMAVAKYKYNPEEKRNAATGMNAGSIQADVQTLASNLKRTNLNFNIDEGTVKSLLDEAVDALLK